jgi:ribonuclease HII
LEYKSQKNVAGVDEVGRGSLIGPVYAATVVFKKGFDKKKVKDSKKLSPKKREFLENYIKKNSYWAIGTASKKEIEKINILNASLLAMKRSILKLKFKPKIVKVDGNKKPNINNLNIKSVVRGDQKIPEISAASILAKVSRDRLIKKMSKKFKAYLWDKNIGYGTRDHLSAIKKFGITKHHRKTFKPIHNILSHKYSKAQLIKINSIMS